MASIQNNFTETSLPDATIGDPTPTVAVAAASEDFTSVVVANCGTIAAVTYEWGDLTGNTAATPGAGDTYVASHTYATAGTYALKVIVTYSGSTHVTNSKKYPIVVS